MEESAKNFRMSLFKLKSKIEAGMAELKGEEPMSVEECGIVTIPSNLAFDSYEKAKTKAKELNNESLSELEEVVKSIKGYYPL